MSVEITARYVFDHLDQASLNNAKTNLFMTSDIPGCIEFRFNYEGRVSEEEKEDEK